MPNITPASPNITNTSSMLADTSSLMPPAARVSTAKVPLPASLSDFDVSNNRANLKWIRQAFMLNTLSNADISQQDMARRIATTAAWKYTDTTLGGNFAINSPPQFTQFADVTMGGDLQYQNAPDRTTRTTSTSYGMGRYYSEVIDDNAQLITMSFGVQTFNSLTSFFGNFYDPQASALVRTGRANGLFFQAGKLAGTLLAVPFYPLILGSQILKSGLDIPSTKYSYFKQTMPLYWNAVNTILNGITANIGIHYRQLSKAQQLMYEDPNGSAGLGGSSDVEGEIAQLAAFLPDVYMSYTGKDGQQVRGGIDVYAVAGRAQRLASAHIQRIQDALKNAASEKALKSSIVNALSGNLDPGPQTYLSDAMTTYLNGPGGTTKGSNAGATIESMAADAQPAPGSSQAQQGAQTSSFSGNVPAAVPNPSNPNNGSGAAGQPTTDSSNSTPDATTSDTSLSARLADWFKKFIGATADGLHDGMTFVSFRTDYAGTIGESFSNSMKDSDLMQKINSMSSDARSASYDFAGGHIFGGVAGAIVDKVMGSVRDTVNGILSGVQLSGLAALAGAAYVDIPRMYDSSNVTLPTQSFTIELRSWSGHRISLLQNIYLPLACLLAGVMPRSTGTESYNGPFCCQLFAKGRMQVRNGLITDMSITRGTGNVGWSPEMMPLGIDVTFTVTDFTSIMHMPIVAASGFIDKAILAAGNAAGNAIGGESGSAVGEQIASALVSGTYQDDSVFSDYLAVLAGLGWRDQLYSLRKWSIARDRTQLNFDTFRSPYHAATWFAGSLPGRVLSGFAYGTDRP